MTTFHIKETKAEVTHEEMKRTEAVAESEGGDSNVTQQVVDKESLTLWQCLKKYKYASLVCVLASIGSLSDGYQVQMSGSIIALPGFIRQFGALQKSGKYVIDPQYISLWGCKCLFHLIRTLLTMTFCSS